MDQYGPDLGNVKWNLGKILENVRVFIVDQETTQNGMYLPALCEIRVNEMNTAAKYGRNLIFEYGGHG